MMITATIAMMMKRNEYNVDDDDDANDDHTLYMYSWPVI